jgi:hypothetical protein
VLAYEIASEAPNDYVGVERGLDPVQDWHEFTHLALWLETDDRSDRQLVVQWYEPSREVWRHRTTLSAIPDDGPLLIPLEPALWEWPEWAEFKNGELDLDAVGRIGLFVGHTGPGAGTLRFGTIELVQVP